MSWYSFDDGVTIGKSGSEGGIVLNDDEHILGARITLENCANGCHPITCGIYGWFFHTRFLTKEEAFRDYEPMKQELDRIRNLIPKTEEADDEKMSQVSDEILKFIDLYP